MGEERNSKTVRHAAKVILVDQDDSVLLFRGGDPAQPHTDTWWFPPGGGLEASETSEQAARREVREETGLVLEDLGPIVYHRTAEFSFDGQTIVAEEDYFIVRVDHFEVSTDGWTDLEQDIVEEHRWWRIADLRTTDNTIYPERLLDLLRDFA